MLRRSAHERAGDGQHLLFGQRFVVGFANGALHGDAHVARLLDELRGNQRRQINRHPLLQLVFARVNGAPPVSCSEVHTRRPRIRRTSPACRASTE